MALPCWLVLLASLVPPAVGSWGVAYPESVLGVSGSCVVIPCTLTHPPEVSTRDGIVAIWYKDYDGQKTLVYHSEGQEVDPSFRARVSLVGQPSVGKCNLLLWGVTPQDSGPYRFRFEIVNGDRWSATRDVVLRVSDTLEQPRVTASKEQTEGQTATLECYTPYFCPDNFILHWVGYDPQVSTVSSEVQLDTSGVGHQLNLTTSFTWKDHSRKLLCELSYNSRKATREVVLWVRHAPKDPRVLVSPSGQGIHLGDTVSLSCQVSSSYPPVSGYQWYKDGVSVGNQQLLTLRDVGHKDQGQYSCQAQNALGTSMAPNVTLYIFSAEISVSPAAEVQEGTATTLSCNVPGWQGQDLNYTWYKNNAWLGEGPSHTLLFAHITPSDTGQYSCKVTNERGSDTSQAISLSVACQRLAASATHNTLQLEIHGAGPRDGGKYQCVASNPYGSTSASKGFIIPGGSWIPPRPPVMSSFLETQSGRLGIIQCTAESDPEANLTLWRGGDIVACRWGCPVAPSPRVHVTWSYNSLKVEIQEVVLEDEGTYVCWAGNAEGNSSTTLDFRAETASITLAPSSHVLEGQAANLTCHLSSQSSALPNVTWYHNGQQLAQAAQVLLSPSAEVREGEEGTLTCQVAGELQDGTTYTWYRNSLRLQESSENILLLPHVSSTAAASYQCRARHPTGTSISPAVVLSVSYPPRNLEMKAFVESSEGAAVILLCSVESNPPSQVTLLKGGQLVASSPPEGGDNPGQRILMSPTPNALRLEIQEASEDDEGEYECQAQSPLGSAHGSLPLQVQAIRVVMRPSAEVTEGTDVTLTCRDGGSPRGTLYS
ncbi:PREDICTED: sialoadhesin, partial [Chaetura pelagica]|uniref:sialoadhesin n=1 Tax=Chaetura pelagica TaxID=8897 RepID=UPI000523627F